LNALNFPSLLQGWLGQVRQKLGRQLKNLTIYIKKAYVSLFTLAQLISNWELKQIQQAGFTTML